MFTKPLVLTALLSQGVSAVEYPDKAGACPFKPGALPSKVSGSFDNSKINGRWMNVFDRGSLNENHQCYGVKMMPVDSQGVFEYLKATKMSELKSAENFYPSYDQDDQSELVNDDQYLAYDYHVFNGFQLNFNHPTDKSVAYVQHRDTRPEDHLDGDIKEHGHGSKEEYYNENIFDSQFSRYAQVLDTDYDKYLVLYQCFETAYYYNKDTDTRVSGAEAWDHATSSSINFSSWPKTEYKFDDKIEVRPRHFENVKILYRPRVEYLKFGQIDDESTTDEDANEVDKQSMKTQYKYPTEEDAPDMYAKIEEMQTLISSMHTSINMDDFQILYHADDDTCDYDAYERYEAQWENETFNNHSDKWDHEFEWEL